MTLTYAKLKVYISNISLEERKQLHNESKKRVEA
jgi:hypothetical protein